MLVGIGAVAGSAIAKGETMLTDLKINSLTEPCGIDTRKPTFSWKMQSDVVGQKQTAYRIVVAKDESLKEVVWDTGKTSTDVSTNIQYAGEALAESTTYYWTVKVWDKNGRTIGSDTASFTVGLFENDSWNGSEFISMGIGAENTHYTVEADLSCQSNAVSLVFSLSDNTNFYMWQFRMNETANTVSLAPHHLVSGSPYFKAYADVDVTAFVNAATFKTAGAHVKLDVTNDTIKTYINGALANTFTISDGPAITVGVLGFRSATGEVGMMDNLKLVDYTDNAEGETIYDFDFNDGTSPFDKGTVTDGKWQMTADLGLVTCKDSDKAETYRKQFTVGKNLKNAVLHTTALGVYDLHLNGERVGTVQDDGTVVVDELKPGYAKPNERVLYSTYVITEKLLDGDNTITATVTSGWYDGEIAYGGNRKFAFRMKLILTYEDGTTEVIGTDDTWKSSWVGPVVTGDIYQGEVYDATADTSYRYNDFDDSTWRDVIVKTDYTGTLSAMAGDVVRVRTDLERTPVSITVYDGITDAIEGTQYGKIQVKNTYADGESFTLKKGETAVFDLGQNFAGRPRVTLSGATGTVVTIRHAEMLNDNDGLISRGNDGPEGSIYTANLRTAKAMTTYTVGGAEKETYFSTHTFYGFRHVEITATADITVYDLKGEVLTSVLENTGTIETSNEKVNRLYLNSLWGQYSNYLTMPTDCPQRDERKGWSADTQIYSTSAAYNANVLSFLDKWMRDMCDYANADPNGAFPVILPGGGDAQLGWSDAGIIVPYNMYKMYGDKTYIKEYYSAMKRYMDVRMAQTDKKGGGHWYGDWLSYESNDEQIMSMLGVAFYAWDAKMMSEMAAAIGNEADAQHYQWIYEIEKNYFIDNYVNKNGTLVRGEQSVCLYALYLNLLPDDASFEAVKQQLLTNLESHGNKLQTGFLGTAILMQTLSEIGADDMAYNLLLQEDNPSWLYSVNQGATTIWERWNSYTLEDGFGPVSMNSFNHYAYGAVSEWMYGYMAGIMYDTENPGFKHFVLQPAFTDKLEYVNASYDSVYGEIVSNWKGTENGYEYTAAVSANTTATVKLDGEFTYTVNGKSAGALSLQKDGIEYKGNDENGKAIFEAVSGEFTFVGAEK